MQRESIKKSVEWSDIVGILCALAATGFSFHKWDRPGLMNKVLRFFGSSGGQMSGSDWMLVGSICTMVLIGFMYARGIFSVRSNSKFVKYLSLLAVISMFSGFFAMYGDSMGDYLNSFTEKLPLVCASVFCVTMLIFGQRGIAGVSFIISLIILMFNPLRDMSAAMGGWGLVYALLIFSSLYLLECVNFETLVDEFGVLYSNVSSRASKTLSQAAGEAEALGSVVKNAAVTAAKVYAPAAAPLIDKVVPDQQRQIEEAEQ